MRPNIQPEIKWQFGSGYSARLWDFGPSQISYAEMPWHFGLSPSGYSAQAELPGISAFQLLHSFTHTQLTVFFLKKNI
jgi:hypothetical protein